MRLAALLLALVVLAAPAWASCESGLVVNSRELAFSYYDAIPMSLEDFTAAAKHEHFRGLAHALAVAQACLDSARMYSCDAGTPPRTDVRLVPRGDLVAGDASDGNALGIIRACANADDDSTCVLWTCELGRYRSEGGARSRWEGASVVSDLAIFDGKWVPSRDATIVYDSCAGSWEPSAFIVRIPGATVAPWSARCGLYFTREDAEREAANWTRTLGKRIRVVRQRVDGALLEQALSQPVEGC